MATFLVLVVILLIMCTVEQYTTWKSLKAFAKCGQLIAVVTMVSHITLGLLNHFMR